MFGILSENTSQLKEATGVRVWLRTSEEYARLPEHRDNPMDKDQAPGSRVRYGTSTTKLETSIQKHSPVPGNTHETTPWSPSRHMIEDGMLRLWAMSFGQVGWTTLLPAVREEGSGG